MPSCKPSHADDPVTLPDAGAGGLSPQSGTPCRVLPHLNVRPFVPADASGVVRCAWLAYGFTRPDNRLYDPDGLIRLNASGSVAGLVAASADGSILGYACLDFAANRFVPEYTDLVIAPDARNNPLLLRRMLEFGRELAIARDCVGVVANAVTAHTISQRGALRFNGVPIGVHLGGVSTRWSLSGSGAQGDVRQSEIAIYMPGPHGAERVLYCPERHVALTRSIYDALNEPVRFADADEAAVPDKPTELSVEGGLRAWGHAVIDVERLGSDAEAAIASYLYVIRAEDIATVLLHLRLSDPAAPSLAGRFERMGFSFSGVFPNAGPAGADDLLIYQYLHGVETDLAGEKVVERCRALHDYVIAERHRVDAVVSGRTLL